MKVEKRDGSVERRIVTAMIVDPVVVGRLSEKWGKGLFRNKWSNLVGGWCVKYFDKYNKAPGSQIESLFESWAASGKDDTTADLVGKFLKGLSDEYESLAEQSNSDFMIDLAAKHFNEVQLAKVKDELEADIEAGEHDKAWKRINEMNKLEIGQGAGVDVFSDSKAIQEAFESESEPIVVYPGDLGKFLGSTFEREGFVSFMAPEKRGKTWTLMDVGFRGALQRRKVAFFEIGDMSQNQFLRRLGQRAARAPKKAGKVLYPRAISYDPDESCAVVDFDEKQFDKDLDWRASQKELEKTLNKRIKMKESPFKLSCHPNDSLTVGGIKAILRQWERSQGWVPDLVVIDYADLIASTHATADTRDEINYNWKQMRSISQEWHCCVVTATQSDAASYSAHTLGRSHFTNDKRKFAHVTAMIGLNQSAEEKEMGVTRWNYIVLRENEFSEGKCVHVAGCLAIGNPAIKSTF